MPLVILFIYLFEMLFRYAKVNKFQYGERDKYACMKDLLRVVGRMSLNRLEIAIVGLQTGAVHTA